MTEEMLRQHERMPLPGSRRYIFHHMADDTLGQPIFFVEQVNRDNSHGIAITTFWYNFSGVGETAAITVAVWRIKAKM